MVITTQGTCPTWSTFSTSTLVSSGPRRSFPYRPLRLRVMVGVLLPADKTKDTYLRLRVSPSLRMDSSVSTPIVSVPPLGPSKLESDSWFHSRSLRLYLVRLSQGQESSRTRQLPLSVHLATVLSLFLRMGHLPVPFEGSPPPWTRTPLPIGVSLSPGYLRSSVPVRARREYQSRYWGRTQSLEVDRFVLPAEPSVERVWIKIYINS